MHAPEKVGCSHWESKDANLDGVDFAGSDPTRKTAFGYGVLSRNIASKLGANWRLLPIVSAEVLFDYLQSRIDKTRLAKVNKGKGARYFSSYDKFVAKHEMSSLPFSTFRATPARRIF